MNTENYKELNSKEYIAKILPILDLLFITLVAFNSPVPWITTPIQLCVPIVGLITIFLFKDSGSLGFYVIGTAVSVPLFIGNLWGTPTCPTWIIEFSFIAGGIIMTTNRLETFIVLALCMVSTVIPLCISGNSFSFVSTVVVCEFSFWFLAERSKRFTDMQKERVEEQKSIIEEKNKEIIDSINYAKRIQRSHLPTDVYIDKTLKRLMKGRSDEATK